VTRSGELAMSSAAAYHREFRVRMLGPRYMEDATERIRLVNASMMSLEEKLDAEDEILNEIEDRIAARQAKTPYLK
jgi:CII-binding regulator of phage lambda lysogenization HflD